MPRIIAILTLIGMALAEQNSVDIFDRISAKTLQIAQCRAHCLQEHLIYSPRTHQFSKDVTCGEPGTPGTCSTCWDFCAKIFTDQGSNFVCHKKRCINKRKNSKQTRRQGRLQESLAHLEQPTFHRCQLNWSSTTKLARTGRQLSLQASSPFAPARIYSVFMEDQGGRWRVVAQTARNQLTFSPVEVESMKRVRIISVGLEGLEDEVTLEVNHRTMCPKVNKPVLEKESPMEHVESKPARGVFRQEVLAGLAACAVFACFILLVSLLVVFIGKCWNNVKGPEFIKKEVVPSVSKLNNHVEEVATGRKVYLESIV